MNHSSAEILGEVSSSVYPFFLMDNFLASNHVICNLIGLPLNLLTAGYIIFKSRLHQNRNIQWLGVAFSNVLVLLEHFVEFYDYQFQSETAKKIFSLMIGLPYGSLLMNLFLSLVDRYVSIAHSAWYKRNVTITWIVSAQIAFFSIICVLMKGPYLFEILPLPPRITITELKFFVFTGFFTILLCVFGQIFVYVKVKIYLRTEKDMDISLSAHKIALNGEDYKKTQETKDVEGKLPKEPQQEISIDEMNRHQAATGPIKKPAAVSSTSPYFIRIGDQAISRMELKAACHALGSVTLLMVFALPTYTTFMFAINADCSPATPLLRQDCSTYLWTFAYTRGISLIYVVVNPIFFAIKNRDLTQALKHSS